MAISAEGFSAWHPETTTRALGSQNAATFLARVERVAIFVLVHRSRLCRSNHYQLKRRPLLDSIVFQCRLPPYSSIVVHISYGFPSFHNFLAVEDESLLISCDAQLILNRHLDKLDWVFFLEKADYRFFARDENHCHVKAAGDGAGIHAADAARAGAGAGTVVETI